MTKKTTKLKDPEQRSKAVLKVQRFWKKARVASTKRVVKRFIESGVSTSNLKHMTFERRIVFLNDEKIFAAFKECMQRIHFLTKYRHAPGLPGVEMDKEANLRIGLYAFKVALFPYSLLEKSGPVPKAMKEAAQRLISAFEQVGELLMNGTPFAQVPHAITQDFQDGLLRFFESYKVWRQPDDLGGLKWRVQCTLQALYEGYALAATEYAADSPVMRGLREMIAYKRNVLRQAAGGEVLEMFDYKHGIDPFLKMTTEDTQDVCDDDEIVRMGSLYALVLEDFTDEQLVHELIMQPTFKMSHESAKGHIALLRLRSVIHDGHWRKLERDLQQPVPCYARVLRLLEELFLVIKSRTGPSLPSDMAKVLDWENVKEQVVTAGCAGAQQVISSWVRIIRRIEAPSRDEETQRMWKAVGLEHLTERVNKALALVKGLKFLLNRVNSLRIDANNARLQLLWRRYKQGIGEFVCAKFKEELAQGTVTLERTSRWIRSTNNTWPENEKATLKECLKEGVQLMFHRVHAVGVLNIIKDVQVLSEEMCPETMRHDLQRLREFQYHFLEQVKTAMLLYMMAKTIPEGFSKVKIVNVLITRMQPMVKLYWYPFLEMIEADPVWKAELKDKQTPEEYYAFMKALDESMRPTFHLYPTVHRHIFIIYWKLYKSPNEELSSQYKGIPFEPLLPWIKESVERLRKFLQVNMTVYKEFYKQLILEHML